MSSPIRNREIYVSDSVYRSLRTAAEWMGVHSPDQLADQWLSERIENDPVLRQLNEEISAACKPIYRKYEAKHL